MPQIQQLLVFEAEESKDDDLNLMMNEELSSQIGPNPNVNPWVSVF